MKKLISTKLHSSSGETLTEVLVASLVVVLGSILLATMVSASYRMIRNSEKSYDQYLAGQNMLASHGAVQTARTDSEGATEGVSYSETSNESVDVNGSSYSVDKYTVTVNGQTTGYYTYHPSGTSNTSAP